MATLDWSQCPAVESVPDRRSGAVRFAEGQARGRERSDVRPGGVMEERGLRARVLIAR
jgi:hypothetical protein